MDKQSPTASLLRLAFSTLLALAAGPASAAIFTVGPDVDCDYATVQDAINALPAAGRHEIRMVNSVTYTAQALAIAGRTVTLRGGYGHCADATPTGSTELSGQGGSHDSVLTITGTGNDVTLENLVISHGDEVYDGYGGGIDFRGAGTLTLRDTEVILNYAGYGGGINVDATGGLANVSFGDNVLVLLNTAQFSGGGVRVSGTGNFSRATLDTYFNGSDDQIASNTALGIDLGNNNQPKYGYGGGVEVTGAASAYFGSGTGEGILVGNLARYGGGLAVNSTGSGTAQAYLDTPTGGSKSARIFDNQASQTGGGVYVDGAHAAFCADSARIDGNSAQNGSAVYLDADAALNFNSCFGSEAGLRCPAGMPCNSLDDNVAEDANGQATAGATIVVQNHATSAIERAELRGNQGGQVLLLAGDGSHATCDNCLIVDNTVTGSLIRAQDDADQLIVSDSTIADNTIGDPDVLVLDVDDYAAPDAGFEMDRSILWQPGKTSLRQPYGNHIVEYVIASERTSLDSGDTVLVEVADPRFEDPAHGDYHPIAASPAVDHNPEITGWDLDGHLRGSNLVAVVDDFGPGDDGAYERTGTFSLVRNHSFGSDLRLWDDVTPGVSTWQTNGTVEISGTPGTNGDLVGLRQCVRIPGPGTYALDGFAFEGGGIRHDYARLHWKLRPASTGETCDGSVTAEGDLYMPHGSSFAAPASPAYIAITPAEWSTTTIVEISLVARDGGITYPSTATAYFDLITLEPIDDVIFADGFDASR